VGTRHRTLRRLIFGWPAAWGALHGEWLSDRQQPGDWLAMVPRNRYAKRGKTPGELEVQRFREQSAECNESTRRRFDPPATFGLGGSAKTWERVVPLTGH
jgi:hypothetical protein